MLFVVRAWPTATDAADGRQMQFAAVKAVNAMRRSTNSPHWYIALDDRQHSVFKQVHNSSLHSLYTLNTVHHRSSSHRTVAAATQTDFCVSVAGSLPCDDL